jgi:cobalt-zinc-cadmium efflux system protein
MGDMLASIGVIIAAIIILFTGQFWVDPLVSILIGLIILYAAFSILREGVRVILEASPRDVNVLNMIEVLKKVPGVLDVHDIHVWSITPELRAMNGHILIEDIATSAGEGIRREAEKILREQFNITHTTLQMESQKCQSSDAFCTLEELHPERDPSLKKQDIKAQAKT